MKKQCHTFPWTSNDKNVTQQALFDLASYNFNKIVSLTKVYTNNPMQGDVVSIKLKNLSSSYHEIVEQRAKTPGKCWTFVLHQEVTKYGIQQIRFFLGYKKVKSKSFSSFGLL